MRNGSKRCRWGIAWALLPLLFCGGLTDSPAEVKILRVGFSIEKVDVTSRITRKDVEAATKIILNEILRDRGEFRAVFKMYEKNAELVAAVLRQEVDFVEMDPYLYFSQTEGQKLHFRPTTIVQFSASRLENFVLLGRPGETFDNVASSRIRIHRGRDRGLGGIWLDDLLESAGLGDAKVAFKDVQLLSKVEEVLLPTFFGKADMCLVLKSDYEVAAELNPQIGKRLVPIATSPGMPLVVAGPTSAVSEKMSELLSAQVVPDLKKDAGGRQALNLMGVTAVTSMIEGDLDALEALVARKLRRESRVESAQTGGAEP